MSASQNKIVFMFSGQGSQYYGMGRELYQENNTFRKWMLHLDDIAHRHLGISIVDQLYNTEITNGTPLIDLRVSHPAIVMVEYALYKVVQEQGVKSDVLLGSSLGEYTAAAVGGVISVEQMLALVIGQAIAVEKHCPAGGMLAVLSDHCQIEDYIQSLGACEIAAINFDSHCVVSGDSATLVNLEQLLKTDGFVCQALDVSYGFHSKHIDFISTDFNNVITKQQLSPASLPIISCHSPRQTGITHSEHFWNVVRKPILFADAVSRLENEGCHHYIDLGPAGTLANFVKYNLPKDSHSTYHTTMNPLSNDLTNINKVTLAMSDLQPRRENNIVERDTSKAFMFPGQGSQHKGMGAKLFERFPHWVAVADSILGYSIETLCLEDPLEQLAQTQFTQPALFVVNALSYLASVEDGESEPAYVAGHSLGEYNALFSAGVFDFETGLRLVQKRGQLMARAENGGMAAVVGLSEQEVREVIADNNLKAIDIANLNSPTQIVISGPKDEIISAQAVFEAVAKLRMYAVLKVGGAFHSRYMSAFGEEFRQYLQEQTFNAPNKAVISNYRARPYKKEELIDTLVSQLSHSVKWVESICYLMGLGVSEFVEVGPGNTLKNLARRIENEAEPLVIEESSRSDILDEAISEGGNTKPERENLTESQISLSSNKPGVTPLSARASSKSRKVSSVSSPAIIQAMSLGSSLFRTAYKSKYAYYIGAMAKGIASTDVVIRAGKSGLMAFYGTGGLRLNQVEEGIRTIQAALPNDEPYGFNLLCNVSSPETEMQTVDLYLRYGIRVVEAAAYPILTSAIVKYRIKGLSRNSDGSVAINNNIIAKVSRAEVADAFLNPAPAWMLEKLVAEGEITAAEAQLAVSVPMADDICVESDSGGHTDMGGMTSLLPTICQLRERICRERAYPEAVRIGAGGGVGTPESAAAAFLLGAEFIVTGSINQCTVEAGTSDVVKDMLQEASVHDTTYVPAGDMFEIGARAQVLSRGVFFPARANKLYDLWRFHDAWEEIDAKTRKQIEEKYFRRSFESVFEETAEYYARVSPTELAKANNNPKHKLALVFKWYFVYTMRIALTGDESDKVNFQVHCGPAMGAFNHWVKGSSIQSWRHRHVDDIAERLMVATSEYLSERIQRLIAQPEGDINQGMVVPKAS